MSPLPRRWKRLPDCGASLVVRRSCALRMDMPAQYIQADPHVWDVDGRVALTRGPLVYCLEGRDHGGSLSGLRYCRDALYQPVPGDGVLAGEVLLTGPAHAAPQRTASTRPTPGKHRPATCAQFPISPGTTEVQTKWTSGFRCNSPLPPGALSSVRFFCSNSFPFRRRSMIKWKAEKSISFAPVAGGKMPP